MHKQLHVHVHRRLLASIFSRHADVQIMQVCMCACRATHVYTYYTVIHTHTFRYRPPLSFQELRRKAKEEILIEPRDALPRRSSLSGSVRPWDKGF